VYLAPRAISNHPHHNLSKKDEFHLHQQASVGILSLLAISACTSWTPPIARDLPRSFVPTSDFDNRIRQRFPAGSDEAVLVAEMRHERFSIDKIWDWSGNYRHLAHYTRQEIACRTSWDVLWNGEQGKILNIQGRYTGEICL
jgi:hypothetical protein